MLFTINQNKPTKKKSVQTHATLGTFFEAQKSLTLPPEAREKHLPQRGLGCHVTPQLLRLFSASVMQCAQTLWLRVSEI